MGATLGRGWLLPRPVARVHAPADQPLRVLSRGARRPATSPFEQASAVRPSRRSTKPLLLSMSHRIEERALGQGETAVLAAAFEDARYLTPRTANRRVLRQRLTEALDAARDGSRVGLLFCDLDGFKAANDLFGHPIGDAVLRAVAGRLRAAVPQRRRRS